MHKVFCLSNGIRVVTETTDYVKSVSAGVWVGVGSVNETAENNGISHFIEHMLFKGTHTRSAREIAECMDSVGGQLNAVTAKEYTCYYTRTLTEYMRTALELLADMICNSTFESENIELERKVIIEEISMGEDEPENLIYDIVEAEMWSGDALGFPVTGSEKSVSGISRDMLLDYFHRNYVAENIVISIVGNFDEDEAIEILEKNFSGILAGGAEPKESGRVLQSRKVKIVKKDFEQCQLCIGFDGYSRRDIRHYNLAVVNALFGGNMSSRLFQKVREESGLAYSVYSELSTYAQNGSLRIYAGLSPENIRQVLEIISNEIRLLKENKLTREEIETAKTQFKAALVMDSEGVAERECANGKTLLRDGRVKTIDDAIAMIDGITPEGVAEAIDFVFDSQKLTIAVLGRFDGDGQDLLDAMKF